MIRSQDRTEDSVLSPDETLMNWPRFCRSAFQADKSGYYSPAHHRINQRSAGSLAVTPHANFLSTSVAFVPPKPNELLIATSIFIDRASCGT